MCLQKQIHIARELFLVQVGHSSRCAQPTVRLFMFDFFLSGKTKSSFGNYTLGYTQISQISIFL